MRSGVGCKEGVEGRLYGMCLLRKSIDVQKRNIFGYGVKVIFIERLLLEYLVGVNGLLIGEIYVSDLIVNFIFSLCFEELLEKIICMSMMGDEVQLLYLLNVFVGLR